MSEQTASEIPVAQTRNVENPGELFYTKIVKQRRGSATVYHVMRGNPAYGLDFNDGQEVHVQWPDKSTTRQNMIVIMDQIESRDEGLIESRLFGFYRKLEDGYQLRGLRPKSGRIFIGIEEVKVMMTRIELIAAGVEV